jgi:hypothetical protein
MFGNPLVRVWVGKVLAGLTVLSVGGGGGAVLGIANLAGQASPQLSANRVTALGAPNLIEVGELVVQESSPPVQRVEPTPLPAAAAVKKIVKVRAPKAAAPASAPASASALNLPSISAGSVNCDRLDDPKIQWLRRLVAKTRAANPGTEAVADRIDAQLAGSLGRSMCAEEAQSQLSTLCADRAVWEFMQKSVKELPFFIRPLVGDPCNKDIVAAAQKYLP